MRLEEVVERLKEGKRELRSKYKVKALALFGLTVRNEKGRDLIFGLSLKSP